MIHRASSWMAQEEFVPADTQSGFLGWRICAAGVLTQAVAIGFTLGSVGVFAAPLAEELGATATQFNLAVSLFSLVMNLSMPVIGGLLDRGSIRRVMTIGAFVLAISLAALSRATELWQVGVLFGAGCAIGMTMLGPMSSSTLMANWFDRLRGRALGFANAGGPAGPAIVAPAAAFAIASFGWRPTLLGFAALTLVIAVPAVHFGIIDRPGDVGQHPDGEAAPASPIEFAKESPLWDAANIIRCRDFWILALAAAPFGATGIVLAANSVPYMAHLGVSAEAASFVVVLQSVGAVSGPLIFGTLADKIHPRLLFVGLIAAICLALGGLTFEPSYAAALALFSVVGLVAGSMMPVYGALIGRLFGAASFGQVMGMGALVGLPVIFLAPLGFGYAFDATNSYSLGLVVMIVSLCLSGLLFSLLPKGLARRSGSSELAAEAQVAAP